MIPSHAALPLSVINATLQRTNAYVEKFGHTLAARVYNLQRMMDERRITAAEARAILEMPR